MRAAQLPPHPDRIVDRREPRAVVGWTHRRLPNGIELNVQSAQSAIGLENGQVAACQLVMTDNQALLLARYLMIAGNHDPRDLGLDDRRRPWWRRWTRGD